MLQTVRHYIIIYSSTGTSDLLYLLENTFDRKRISSNPCPNPNSNPNPVFGLTK